MSRIKAKTVAIAASEQVCRLSMVVLLAAGVCFGKPAVSLSRKSGPPTSKMLVSGSGYKPYAEVDIYFDTKDEAKAVANGSGKFFSISVEAPRAALPGKHWVSAVQRAGKILRGHFSAGGGSIKAIFVFSTAAAMASFTLVSLRP